MKLNLVDILKIAVIRMDTIKDIALEDDVLNDEYIELGKLTAIIRNLLKIEKAQEDGKDSDSYSLYKISKD